MRASRRYIDQMPWFRWSLRRRLAPGTRGTAPKWILWYWSAAIVLLFPGLAGATVVVGLGLPELLERSGMVVVGEVVDVRFVDPRTSGRPTGVTETTVAVHERWLDREGNLGRAGSVTISQLGGWGVHRWSRVVGDPVLSPGDRVVVFLRAAPGGRWALTALAQSVFWVDPEGRLHRRMDDLGWAGAPPPAEASSLDLVELRLAVGRGVRP